MQVFYFCSDITDAAVLKRVQMLQNCSCDVLLIGFKRSRYDIQTAMASNGVVCLGAIEDGSYAKRIMRFMRASKTIYNLVRSIGKTDKVIAKNLDMALLVVFCTLIGLKRRKITYEVLDINPLLEGESLKTWTLRKLERCVLEKTELLLVSSYGYIQGYFEPLQSFSGRHVVLENKLSATQLPRGNRPRYVARRYSRRPDRWKLGWFGTLKSGGDLEALCEAAKLLEGRLTVDVYGILKKIGREKARSLIEGNRYVTYRGAYNAFTDLPDMYNDVDFMWCADFKKTNLNGALLMPNRIYEAGYFGVPVIVSEGTYTDAFIKQKSLGWSLRDLSASGVAKFFDGMTVHEYNRVVREICETSDSVFVGDSEGLKLVNALKGL